MLKPIVCLLRQDVSNTLRDNLMVYALIGPILLAFGARLFLPSLDQNSLTLAVLAKLEPRRVQRLQQIATVQMYADADAVAERVLRNDDVPGVVLIDQEPVLMLEGNESQGAESLQRLVGQALSGEAVASFQRTSGEGARSFITEYTAIVFIMIGLLLGSLLMAFNIIEDKETYAIKALGVSPLSMVEMTLSRGLFALAVSLVLVLVMTGILVGTQVNYGYLLISFLFSMALPILVGYVVGGLADSQLQAMAVLKFLTVIYLTLPAITVFMPRSWHVFFYVLPNYWMWQTFESVLIGETGGFGLWTSGVITLAGSLALVVLFLPVLRRQLKLR
jgi:ABC-2 type transport system permease protein